MPEVYASNEVTAELLDPVSGSVITSVSIPYRRDLTISERPVYAQRGYHRSNTLCAAHLRSLGSVSIRKDADSLALAAEIKRWQKGVVFYALSSDLKGQRYRHPHLRVTFTNADGSTDVVTAYNVKLSDRSLSAPDGGIVGDSISLDVLGGFEPKADSGEPVRALDFHRTGSATYLSTAGTLTTAGDGVARFGLPGVVRRNLLRSTTSLTDSAWTKDSTVTVADNAAPGPFDGTMASKVTFGTTGGHGIYQSVSGLTVGTAYALSVWARVDSGTYTINLNINGTNVPLAITTAWTRLPISQAATAANHFPKLGGTGTAGVFYIFVPQLEIGSSPSATQPTNATGPDLTHPLNGAGLVLEGAGTNLLQSNVATGTDTLANNTGFSAAASFHLAAGATISTTTSQAFQGSRSLSVACSGASQGVETTAISLAANTTYSLSVRAKAGAGSLLQLTGRDYTNGVNAANANITTTGGWDYAYTTITTGASAVADFRLVVKSNQAAAVTFYVDTLQVEASPFPTSWVDGTRSPDLCGIVPPHNLLKWSEDFSNAAWTKTGVTIGAKVAAPDGTMTATSCSFSGSNALRQINGKDKVAGRTFTNSVWLRCPSGTVSARVLVSDYVSTNAKVETVTVTTAWQRFSATGTFPGSASGTLTIQIDTNGVTATLEVLGAQGVEGSHPGTYVKTTDTPIPAPVSPALDPAWSQNGRIKVRILPAAITHNREIGYFGALQSGVAAGVLRLCRGGSTPSSSFETRFERAHNGATGTFGQAGRGMLNPSIQTFYDSAPHDVELEWTNEINEATGVREMWQRLYVDGALVASQDVAALYGASAWATIDPSRLVSDGNCFSVLSDLTLEYPSPRAGYRPTV